MSETQDINSVFAEIIEPQLAAVAALCRHLGVCRVDLFGSAVTGRFDPQRSDIDFLVEFEQMTPDRYARACFELRTGLEQLFERSVDVLTDASLANPYLRHQIDSEKRCIYPSP